MSDWSNGSVGGAVLRFLWTFFTLIAVPLMVYYGVAYAMEQMAEQGFDEIFGSGDDFLPVMKDIVDRIVLYSIPLVILSIPIGYYPKGNSARVPFKFMFAIYLAIWIWLVADGGIYTMQMNGMTFGGIYVRSIDVTLDLMYIVYIVMIICIMKALLAFTEYRAYREEYHEKLQKKEEKRRRKKGEASL